MTDTFFLPRLLGWLIILLSTGAGAIGCGKPAESPRAPSDVPAAPSAAALRSARRVRALLELGDASTVPTSDLPGAGGGTRQRPPVVSAPLSAVDFERVGEELVSRELAGAAVPSLRVTLPVHASRAIHVVERHAGVAVSPRLLGASDAEAELADGYVVYRGAAPGGFDVLHRVTTSRDEDFIYFQKAPERPEVRYSIELGAHVAGLRLIDDAVEFVDSVGAPRLRVTAPVLIDARGRRVRGHSRIQGCAVDENPAPPWDRPVTAPAADRCVLSISWSADSVVYPAVLDPGWVQTGQMNEARVFFSSFLLQDGRVLALGAAPALSCEIYDPASRTWALTSPLPDWRVVYTAAALPNGKMLLAGGYSNHAVLYPPSTWSVLVPDSAIYSVATGKWASAAPMLRARNFTAAAVLPSGKVLVAGGTGPDRLPTSDAQLYDPLMDRWTAAASLGDVRTGGSATLLHNGDVLICGGFGAMGYLATCERYDPAANQFNATGSLMVARAEPSASLLPDGRVLMVGGKGPKGMLASAELYDPMTGTFSAAGTSSVPRYRHQVAVLQSGDVIVMGGSDAQGGPALKAVEQWSAGNLIFSSLSPLPQGRTMFGSALLAGGNVLVFAGDDGMNTKLASADIYDTTIVGPAANGASCVQALDCKSGFCVQGLCCDSACAVGPCARCDLPGKRGACTTAPRSFIGQPPCSPYLCDGAVASCPSSCTVNGDCAPGNICLVGKCARPLGLAAPCNANSECRSGLCIDANNMPCAMGPCNQGVCTLCDLDVNNQPTELCTKPGCHNCPAGQYCGSTHGCQDLLPQGAPAAIDGDRACASGHVVEGVCCAAASCGPCGTCAKRGAPGTCQPRYPYEYAPACDPALCDGTSMLCPAQCATNADCITYQCNQGRCAPCDANGNPSCPDGHVCVQHACVVGYLHKNGDYCDGVFAFCTSGHCANKVCCDKDCWCGDCATGTCIAGLAGVHVPRCGEYVCDGVSPDCPTSCKTDAFCLHTCADGVCCTSSCGYACEACNVPGSEGTCVAVTGKPRGSHGPCPGAGTSCEGFCDGRALDCTLPVGQTCQPGGCNAAGTQRLALATCNVAGQCPKQVVEQDCRPYACRNDLCVTECSGDTDCSAPARCVCPIGQTVGECRLDLYDGGDTSCAAIVPDDMTVVPRDLAGGGSADSASAPFDASSAAVDGAALAAGAPSGCSCDVAGRSPAPGWMTVALLLTIVWRRRSVGAKRGRGDSTLHFAEPM